MGFGCKLSMMRWGLPSFHSPFTSNSSPPCCSAFLFSEEFAVRGKELDCGSGRMPLLTINIDESEMLHRDALRTQACSSLTPLTVENDYSNLELILSNRSDKGSHCVMNKTQELSAKDISVYVRSLQVGTASNFRVLMENISVLENKIADSDSLKLERDILVQLGRLGALELFHACLSRTRAESALANVSNSENQVPKDIKENKKDGFPKKFVSSNRKEYRKSKHLKRLQAVSDGFVGRSETASEASPRLVASSVAHKTRPMKRRVMFSKNEAELSRGVKEVAKLEKVKASLEKEIGRPITLSYWAEAAGIDVRVLQHKLHFGWYCQDELLTSGRSLVLYLARNYRGLGVAHEDLIQAGNIGILQGAERFDHTRGYRFSTYVQYWIRKVMSQLVSQHGRGIKVPSTMSTAINRIKKARKILKRSRGRHPDDAEVAELTGLKLNKIQSADKCLRIVGSIDQNVGNCMNIKFLECTPDTTMELPEKTVMKHHMIDNIDNLLQNLDPKERQVLMLRYGFGGHCMSLHEVGKIFDVSKEWIRKMEKRALTKLTNDENQKNLRHFLNL